MADADGNRVSNWWCHTAAWVQSETSLTATIRVQVSFWSDPWGYQVYNGNKARAYCDGQDTGYVAVGGIVTGTGVAARLVILERDFAVSKSSSGRNVWCVGGFHLGGYQTGTSEAGMNVWVNGISYQKPHAPANCSVSRISDTQQRVTWSGNYTGMDGLYPWANVLVDRSVDGGGWQQIATLDWSAVNYTDGSTTAGHRYSYALRSKGHGGTSDRASAGSVTNTPLAPTSVNLTKVTDMQVSVSAVGASSYTESFEMQSRLNGGDWGETKTVKAFPVTDEPGAGKATYRVRAVAAGLRSAWTESAEIMTIAPPLAPAVRLSASVLPTGSSATISWTPNHIDGTEQSAAQVELTPPTGSTVTVDVDGATASYQLDDLAKGQWRFRVRTKGLDPGWGEWSSYAALVVADPPQAWWVNPGQDGDTVSAVPLAAAFEISDETGVSSIAVELARVDGSARTVIDSTALAASAREWKVGSYSNVANGAEYELTLSVRAGSGLAVTATRRFATAWPSPIPPAATVTYGQGLSASVSVRMGSGDGVAPASYDVARVLADGSTAQVATGLLEGQQAIDRIPPLNTPYGYRVTSIAESGVATTRDFDALVTARAMAYNFGADASRAFVALYDLDYSGDSDRAEELYHFAGRGGLPLSYGLDELDASTSTSFSMLADQHTEFEALRRSEREGWWRGPCGERVFGSMSFKSSVMASGLWQGSVEITETEWEEPTDG